LKGQPSSRNTGKQNSLFFFVPSLDVHDFTAPPPIYIYIIYVLYINTGIKRYRVAAISRSRCVCVYLSCLRHVKIQLCECVCCHMCVCVCARERVFKLCVFVFVCAHTNMRCLRYLKIQVCVCVFVCLSVRVLWCVLFLTIGTHE
jgi:hypothetical protein